MVVWEGGEKQETHLGHLDVTVDLYAMHKWIDVTVTLGCPAILLGIPLPKVTVNSINSVSRVEGVAADRDRSSSSSNRSGRGQHTAIAAGGAAASAASSVAGDAIVLGLNVVVLHLQAIIIVTIVRCWGIVWRTTSLYRGRCHFQMLLLFLIDYFNTN